MVAGAAVVVVLSIWAGCVEIVVNASVVSIIMFVVVLVIFGAAVVVVLSIRAG